MKEENTILKLPEGVSSQGMVDNLGEAYLKAIIALPEMLGEVCTRLDAMIESLDIMALCVQRRALGEGVISQEDLDVGGEDEQGAN